MHWPTSKLSVVVSINIDFLQRLIASRPFQDAELDTGLIAGNHSELFPSVHPIERAEVALAVGIQFAVESAAHISDVANPYSPWARASYWRLNGNYIRTLEFAYGKPTHRSQTHVYT